MSLQGQIEEMGLGAVIQALSLNRYRGTLRIESEEAGSQFFFISEGEIVLVRQVQRDPLRLGDLLVRAGKVSHVQLTQALDRQKKEEGKRLGEVLVDMDLVTQDDIDKVIRGKFEEEFLDLFLLDRGRFEFIFGLTPEALFAPEEKLERVTLNTSGLMLEAMRRLDELQDMIKSIGSLDTMFQNRVQSMGANIVDYQFEGVTLPGKVRVELYELFDGTRSVREVLGQAIRQRVASRMETFLYLNALRKNELIKPLEFRTLFQGAKSALEAGDVPSAAKYIRAILGQKGQLDVALIKRYLTFLKKYKRPRLAFDEAKLFAANCLARDKMDDAIALYEEAVALEFRNIEVVDRLFYALLRANRRDRAIEVGLKVRDYLGTDEALGVAARVANNLRELDPDNPEVMELSGLVLRRQEQLEQAIKELERALEKGGQSYPRRREVVHALLELQPDRADLKDEREAIEVRETRRQLQREFRRKLLMYGGAILAVVLAWRGWAEMSARSSYAEAETVLGEGVPDFASYSRASRLLQTAIGDGLTTVSGAARRRKEELDVDWDKKMREADAERLRALTERLSAEELRKKEEDRLVRGRRLDDALTEHRRLVSSQDWSGASQKTLAIRQEYGDLGDSRVADLPVYVALTTTPPGADVLREGIPAGTTPCSVPVLLDRPTKITLRLRGYKAAEVPLEAKAYTTKTVALEPGPSWRATVQRAPLPTIACTDQGILVADESGGLTNLGLADGKPRWTIDLSKTLAPLGDAGVPFILQGITASGRAVVALSGQAMAAVELTTGAVEWKRKLSGTEARSFLLGTRLGTQEVLLLARGNSLVTIDAGSGAPLNRYNLPAPAAHAPAVGEQTAMLALQNGMLVGIDLTKKEGAERWRRTEVAARAAPVYSELAQLVFVQEADKVRSFGVADGQPIATLEPQVGAILGVALSNERLYVLGETGQLAALRAYDGQLLLRGTRVAKSPSGGPAVVEQDVIVVDDQGEVLQLTPSARARPGKVSLGGPVTARLSLGGGRIVAVVGKDVFLVEPAAAQ